MGLHRRFTIIIFAVAASAACAYGASVFEAEEVTAKPLPNAAELKQRVLANEKQSAAQKERYLCKVKEETVELNGDGSVKKQESKDYERFFLNGREIDRLLAKDGKPLSDSDEKKEQQRTDKEVKKYSDPQEARKAGDRQQHQIELFLSALQYTNGHREVRGGRKTVVYDMAGDPNFHPTGIEQRFAKALVGRIAIDEDTGELAEMRLRTEHDVKIAGGLLANLHKGFELHLQQTRQTDGVWLASLVQGSGDARAGLFFHPRFRFKQNMGGCRLYSVDATSTPSKH